MAHSLFADRVLHGLLGEINAGNLSQARGSVFSLMHPKVPGDGPGMGACPLGLQLSTTEYH